MNFANMQTLGGFIFSSTNIDWGRPRILEMGGHEDELQRCKKFLGGSGGMLSWEILNFQLSEMLFLAFWG